MGAAISLESDWIAALLGVSMAMFGALAWFVRATVSAAVKELEARMTSDMKEIKGHLGDIAERTGRLETQMDNVVIPRQADIARRLKIDRRSDDPIDDDERRER